MNTCRRLISCNVTPLKAFSPLPECFCQPVPSLIAAAARALLLWRVPPRCPVTCSNDSIWYIHNGGEGLCVWEGWLVGGRGELWFSYVPTLKNIPPRCWRNTATLSLFFSLSFSKLKVLFCVFFRNHLLASRTTPSVARALYFLLVMGDFTFWMGIKTKN